MPRTAVTAFFLLAAAVLLEHARAKGPDIKTPTDVVDRLQRAEERIASLEALIRQQGDALQKLQAGSTSRDAPQGAVGAAPRRDTLAGVEDAVLALGPPIQAEDRRAAQQRVQHAVTCPDRCRSGECRPGGVSGEPIVSPPCTSFGG